MYGASTMMMRIVTREGGMGGENEACHLESEPRDADSMTTVMTIETAMGRMRGIMNTTIMIDISIGIGAATGKRVIGTTEVMTGIIRGIPHRHTIASESETRIEGEEKNARIRSFYYT